MMRINLAFNARPPLRRVVIPLVPLRELTFDSDAADIFSFLDGEQQRRAAVQAAAKVRAGRTYRARVKAAKEAAAAGPDVLHARRLAAVERALAAARTQGGR